MTQINLTDLDFANIRNSLVSFLKKQDTVKDLNFEGSAVSFLLDLLAYNTLYYAHYANMIANEAFLDTAQLEKSLISLVKPLGYVIPTRNSSVASISLNNVLDVGPLLPFTVNVNGTTPEGTNYQFWNIEPISVSNSKTDVFQVYQGNYVSLSYGGDGFDFPDQKILISDLSMDINTLRVSVAELDGTYGAWQRYDLYNGLLLTANTKFYVVERTLNGFIINFGSSVGKKLKAGEYVVIEYLSTSGDLANNCTSFKSTSTPFGSTIVTVSTSRGGRSTPNLEQVKKDAPLVFSAQQRLVTVDDYKSYLIQLGVTNVKVWGGESNTPPTPGRVFYSFNTGVGPSGIILSSKIRAAIMNRSIITVTPEFRVPSTIIAFYGLSINHNPLISMYDDLVLQKIISDINQEYPNQTYDLVFSKEKIKTIVNSNSGYFLNENDWYYGLQTSFISESSNIINFKTSLKKEDIGSGCYSLDFNSFLFPNVKVFVRDVPIIFEGATNPPSIGNLVLFSRDADGIVTNLNYKVGKIDYTSGILDFNKKISNEIIFIRGNPVNQNEYIVKDEYYLRTQIDLQKVTSI